MNKKLHFFLLLLILGCFQSCYKASTLADKGPANSNSTYTKLSGVAALDTSAYAVAVDSSGNAYSAGYTTGNLDNQTLTGTTDAFLIKYNANGTKAWTELLGVAAATTYAKGVAVDTSGNVYVTGYTDADNGDLHGETLTGLNDNAFLIKYNADGSRAWTKILGPDTTASGVAVNTSGQVYVTGWTYANVDGVVKTGISDAFLIKYNADGFRAWTRLSGVAGTHTTAFGVAVDSNSGQVYVAGQTAGNLDGEIKTGTTDAFLIKYNADGTKAWTELSGVVAISTFHSGLAVDSSGQAYVTGWTQGNLDGEIKTGASDAFLIKYNANGSKAWTKLFGVAEVGTYGSAVVVDSKGQVYVTGDTGGDLNGEIKTGDADAFLIKYYANGVRAWTKLLGVAGADTFPAGVAIDSGGQIYVTGATYGNLDGRPLTGDQDAFLTTKFTP